MSDWRTQAACAGSPHGEQFTRCDNDPATTPPDHAIRLARDYCAQCPVIRECGTFHTNENEAEGLYGGHWVTRKYRWNLLLNPTKGHRR